MKKLLFLFRYVTHRLKSVNEHGVHSPFVFYLLNAVIYVKEKYYPYVMIEKLREHYLDSKQKIAFVDFGAGEKDQTQRFVSSIVRNSAKPPKQAQLLFRLVNYFQPQYILEFGTSLGLTTSYLAMASTKSKLITMEGCPEVAKIAEKNVKKLKIKNVEQQVGHFDTILPDVLNRFPRLDFVFFDGNHKKEPTLNYFYQCLELADENSVFVFDDIYWSDGMMEAWEEIKSNQRVTVTIDLFFMGLVFFKKGQEKQHFSIRF